MHASKRAISSYLLTLCALLVSPACLAANVSVTHAWIRLLPGDLPAAGYCVISNGTGEVVTITGASSPVFAHAMLHKSVTVNGLDKMIAVPKIVIEAGKQFSFAPGGYHIMLMPPHKPLKLGERVPVEFAVSGGAPVTARFLVKGAAATGDD